MADRALITGITGQDGAYLSKFLLEKGYEVYGTYRRLSTPNFWRLQYLDVLDQVTLIPADLVDAASLVEAVKVARPQEVYHLAAQSFVGASFEQPVGTGQVTGLAVTAMLEAIRHTDEKIRFYQASSSEIYGNVGLGKYPEGLNEDTPFHPASPYAAAKLYGHWMTRVYREAYGLFAVNGILFNHESPLRGLEFVTRRVSNAAARIKLGLEKEVTLGNLAAQRDWGYAPEYVEAMWLMLQADDPDDYVIATGESHSVEELAKTAFARVGLDWEQKVRVEDSLKRPLDVDVLRGDRRKAQKKLRWKPKTTFKDLVERMVDADLERWERHERGESFPWDADSYPSGLHIKSRSLRV